VASITAKKSGPGSAFFTFCTGSTSGAGQVLDVGTNRGRACWSHLPDDQVLRPVVRLGQRACCDEIKPGHQVVLHQ